jgi:hypothetical protein
MWAMLRVVLFEWILARLGLRWLITLLIAVPLALVFFVGIPTLLVLGALIFFAWRFVKKRSSPAPGVASEVT